MSIFKKSTEPNPTTNKRYTFLDILYQSGEFQVVKHKQGDRYEVHSVYDDGTFCGFIGAYRDLETAKFYVDSLSYTAKRTRAKYDI